MTRKLLAAAALAAAVPLLQGCFPLAVTGVGMGALMATDRRTTGTYIEDEGIEWKALARLREISVGAHVNATSFNRRVLLTGETPTEASVVYLMGLVDRQEADAAVEVARTTSGVSRVVKAFEYLP